MHNVLSVRIDESETESNHSTSLLVIHPIPSVYVSNMSEVGGFAIEHVVDDQTRVPYAVEASFHAV
jgi:hypothetical protein